MVDAAIRRYFAKGREVELLLADYDARVSKAKRKETAATEFQNGRRMLQEFARRDATQVDPSRIQIAPARVELFGIGVTMGVDLAYEGPSGWLLRVLLTDNEIARLEHLRLYATAAALHYERRSGGGRVARVEVWLLRFDSRVAGWPRTLLEISVPRLGMRLHEIVAGTSRAA